MVRAGVNAPRHLALANVVSGLEHLEDVGADFQNYSRTELRCDKHEDLVGPPGPWGFRPALAKGVRTRDYSTPALAEQVKLDGEDGGWCHL
jgi:hypothetical protein